MPDELVAMMTSLQRQRPILAIRSRLIRAAPVRSLGQESTPSKALWMSFFENKPVLRCALGHAEFSKGRPIARNQLPQFLFGSRLPGQFARTSNPRARKMCPTSAYYPVPTIPTLLMLIYVLHFIDWCTLYLGRRVPHEGSCDHCSAGRKREPRHSNEGFAFDLHNAWLGLANPTGKKRDIHRMSESLLCFVDVEGTRVCDVSATFFRVFFRRSLNQSPDAKVSSPWRHELR